MNYLIGTKTIDTGVNKLQKEIPNRGIRRWVIVGSACYPSFAYPANCRNTYGRMPPWR